MNVAAFVDASGELADFYQEGRICLFEKVSGSWTITRTVPLSLQQGMTIAQTRAALTAAVRELDSCEVFLLEELRGILRVYLEELGYRVWKSKGSLQEQLDNVALRESEFATEETCALPGPVPVGDPADETYSINLVELLQGGVPHTSREVLMPFFETVPFRQLEVVCDHVPRWLPHELQALGLRVVSQTEDNMAASGMTVMVAPACGSRSCPPGKRKTSGSCHCG